jgi:uncharacterized spore protein YtfJ
MNENTSFSQNLDTLFSDLHNLVKSDTVLGTPVSVGDKTLVPVMAVTLGYGSTGMGTKVGNNSNASSNGIGLGARVSTSAVMVIDKDNVTMHSVTEKGNMAALMEKVPQALAGMGQNMTGMSQGQQGQQQSQTQGQQGGQQKSSTNS